MATPALSQKYWRSWMGDALEAGVALLGIERERVRVWVWECGCRDRKKRYHEMIDWADKLAQGGFASLAEARLALETLLARPPERVED